MRKIFSQYLRILDVRIEVNNTYPKKGMTNVWTRRVSGLWFQALQLFRMVIMSLQEIS